MLESIDSISDLIILTHRAFGTDLTQEEFVLMKYLFHLFSDENVVDFYGRIIFIKVSTIDTIQKRSRGVDKSYESKIDLENTVAVD